MYTEQDKISSFDLLAQHGFVKWPQEAEKIKLLLLKSEMCKSSWNLDEENKRA